ncbi:hypothetical protein Mal65_27040 [Crateriforma conspicua]|nr:hypothetical protein Mal65_27040 [Crateriforma conspicua]
MSDRRNENDGSRRRIGVGWPVGDPKKLRFAVSEEFNFHISPRIPSLLRHPPYDLALAPRLSILTENVTRTGVSTV